METKLARARRCFDYTIRLELTSPLSLSHSTSSMYEAVELDSVLVCIHVMNRVNSHVFLRLLSGPFAPTL
jgi:hypothetical protein